MKSCSICKLTKELSAFGRDRHKRDGLTTTCKPCSKLVRNGYRAPPKLMLTERICTVCSTLKPIGDYYKHSSRCKSCQLARVAAQRVPADRVLSTRTQSVYKRVRRANDPLFKLRSNIGSLIANSIANKGYVKESSTVSILGCSIEQFKTHLEQLFTIGMSWDNRSAWHIDHIVPLSFAQTEAELLLLNHYTNLRPVWSSDNLSKGKIIVDLARDHPIYKTIMENRITG